VLLRRRFGIRELLGYGGRGGLIAHFDVVVLLYRRLVFCPFYLEFSLVLEDREVRCS
jgi:hypothetical protein